MLKRRLEEKYKFLNISGLTQQDLLRIRKEIKELPPGSAKTNLTEQYKVDYIVTGEVAIKEKRSFLGR